MSKPIVEWEKGINETDAPVYKLKVQVFHHCNPFEVKDFDFYEKPTLYDHVATVVYTTLDFPTDFKGLCDAADYAWGLTQNVEHPWYENSKVMTIPGKRFRSSMVGDVCATTHIALRCEPSGWSVLMAQLGMETRMRPRLSYDIQKQFQRL